MSDIPITDTHTSNEEGEHELAVLRVVRANERTAQRDIARRAGISLGMTNAILKRLSQKGFVTVRRIKGRHMAYAVTPDGVHEIARRTYRYFRRTMSHVSRYKDGVDALVARAQGEGYTAVELVGSSDLDFLLEHACSHELLPLRRRGENEAGPESDGSTFVVYAEAIEADSGDSEGVAWLWNLVSNVETEPR